MAFVETNPVYCAMLERERLATPEDFLGLPSLIITGHPDRNVSKVRIGTGPDSVACLLKREHRVPWKERLVNAWRGFGAVSKSRREAFILRQLKGAGISCPDWLAFGETDDGRAFLLIAELEGFVELRAYLRKLADARDDERRRFAEQVGRLLAKLHKSGFNHGDLYSKHVYVNPGTGAIAFIDWQRARRQRRVSRSLRCRDLATLSATLDESLVSRTDRCICLRAYLGCYRSASSRRATICHPSPRVRGKGRGVRGYLRALTQPDSPTAALAQPGSPLGYARSILRYQATLLRDRRIQDIRRLLPSNRQQEIIWRDGEALCVTQECDKILGEHIPDWLKYKRMPAGRRNLEVGMPVSFPGFPHATLICRRESFLLSWLKAWFQGKKLVSSSVRQAGLILRQERGGDCRTRLLAFGQRQPKPWRVESFILIQSGQPELRENLPCGDGRSPQQEFRPIDDAMTSLTHSLCPAGGEK